MSIDFRGKVIEAIQETAYTTDDKVRLITALPLQINEGYLGACKVILEGRESVEEKLQLLRATFSGLRPENEYQLVDSGHAGAHGGGELRVEPLTVLEIKLTGEHGATPKLVQDLERALPGGTLAEDASGKQLTLTLGDSGKSEAVEAVRRVLDSHGYVRRAGG